MRRTPAKKTPVEEEEPVKQGQKKPPPVEPDSASTSDLLLEAVRANNPDVKEFFRRLAVPHDLFTLNDGRKLKAAPVPYYLGAGSTFVGQLTLKPFDDEWKAGEPIKVQRRDMKSVIHYEENALAEGDSFLNDAVRNLTPVDRLDAVEKVLASALRFHRPAPDRVAREGAAWKDIETRLQDKLLAVRVDRLQAMSVSGNWEDTFAWGDRLTRIYGDAKVHQRIAQELAKLIEPSLKQERYELVRRQIRALERFPQSAAAIQPIAAKLRNQASDLLNQAKNEKDRNNAAKANELVNKADQLWPQLEGLRDFRWKLNKDRPTLGVGVRELPEYFSPATAVIDSEKQAVELIFESLVEAHDSIGGQSYEPALAVELPRLNARGREFRIDRDAHWSTGERVTADDVRGTVQLFGRAQTAGHGSLWSDMIEPPSAGRDPLAVTLDLRQGYVDPLSLMTFKILPSSANLDRSSDPKFAKNPVGSGPYQVADAARLQAEQGSVVFIASPSYHRTRKPAMPFIHEIRFYQTRDAVADFAHGRLHLFLDVSAKQAAELQRGENGLIGTVTVQTMRNRRVNFLAVNHRRQPLQNTALRKAIAHSINRSLILQECFRGESKAGGELPHRPLNGPYPPDSWACDPSVPADPWNAALASKEAEGVRQSLRKVRLTLKYPDGDEAVKDACTRIRDQVQSATGFEIVLVPRTRRELHKDVELEHDYDLAYYSYDYPSEAYCLWPLFNPDSRARERGGSNFLGYHNDGSMESWFHRALGHREFAKVRECTHKIHAEMWAKMPLIPLWQLDTVVAVHKDLTPVRMDPLLIFTDVERWKLGR